MARKKKETNKEYKWSDLQKNVFKFIESGTGHLVIEAMQGVPRLQQWSNVLTIYKRIRAYC